jgi:hypothetical protein
LGRGQLTVVIARDRGVEGNKSKTINVNHSVLWLSGARAIKEDLRKRLSFIVIAHHPDHGGTQSLGEGLYYVAQAPVGTTFSPIG